MTPSIRLSLLKWLIAPLLIINLIGAALTYWLAWAPTQIAFDQSLGDSAWALVPRLKEANGRVLIDLPQQAEQVLRVDHFDAVFFSIRDGDGKTLAGDRDFPWQALPTQFNEPVAQDGAMRGEPVRMILLRVQAGTQPIWIGVAETLRKRTHIRSVIFIALLILESLLTLISVAIAWAAVTRGLRPLKRMQAELGARGHDDLSALDQPAVPLELAPLTAALNELLDRVRLGASAQQEFLANVAHQLRTPLAGLKIQLEWLAQRHATDGETAHSISLMLAAAERMTRQSNQLLALARAEPSRFVSTRLEPVRLDQLVEQSIQHFVEEAAKKQIDLGFDLQPTSVLGERFLLRDMIDNLIDNALRYSPSFGKVTVTCETGPIHAVLSIEDSGPGIASAEQELIFNRFYRLHDHIAGTGLGLAIVRDIVRDHGAQIAIAAGADGKGTIFSVRFALPAINRAPARRESAG